MKIIVNGDDFGLTEGLNQGIMEAFEGGLLKSASLAATGGAFDSAARYAKGRPELSAGLHLILCDERPATSVSAIFRGRVTGEALPSRGTLAAALVSGGLDRAALYAEMRAQVERLLAAGLRVTHLDSHQHVHLLPGIFPLALKLCRSYGIPFVRAAFHDPWSPAAGARRLIQYGMVRAASALALRLYSPGPIRSVPALGFLFAGGAMSAGRLDASLRRLSSAPAVEIVLHPGSNDEATREKYRHWGYRWENDRDLARSKDLAALFSRLNVEVSSFTELKDGAGRL